MKRSFKRAATLLMVAAMVLSLMVPAFAANNSYSETPYIYEAGEYTFGKISHPNNPISTPDGIVDYMGNGSVAVSGSVEGADGQGERGESYSWSAMAYGDYVYVGTCYAAMGQTLSAMDSIMGHDFDEEVMRAELNAIFNGTFFYGEEDGVDAKSVFVKVNVHTGEVKLLMAKSFNNIAPQFRNAIAYKDKLYFCGSVTANGRSGLPSVYEIDPKDDSFKCVYEGLSNMQEYMEAYKKGICTGIRGMAVYNDKLVISNVGVDGSYILMSDDPSKGFTKIATQSDLYNYPAVRYVDSVYGGGVWEIVEYNGSLYVAMCTGTPETRVGDNMRSFAIVRGDCSGDWNDPAAWKWTPVIGDLEDGAQYTFGIDPERTRAAACNMCIYDGYLYIGEYNDEEIPLEELMFKQDFGFLARNLEQSVNLYRMSIGSDGKEKIELVAGEPTKMFPKGGILCKESGFGDYENQYIWQSKVFDGKLFIGTFDTSSLLQPLGQFTNGDILRMSREEWASQINYLKVMLELMIKSKGDKEQAPNGEALTRVAADDFVAQTVEEVNEGVTEPEKISLTATQAASLTENVMNGTFSGIVNSIKTIKVLKQINDYLASLTDKIETNDIAGFVETYEKLINLYKSICDKLPDSIKNAYEMLVRVTQLENMKDLLKCLKILSTAERGFGLYAIESNNGKLSLDTLTRNGFGDPFNHGLRAFAVNEKQGWMIIGTANPFMGTQLWRTTIAVGTDKPDYTFKDIADSGYRDYIVKAAELGIINGYDDGTFRSAASVTRAQFITMLYRAVGSPEAAGKLDFKDNGDIAKAYEKAVVWGVEQGVIQGYNDGNFCPNQKISRAQMATFMYRYLKNVEGYDFGKAEAAGFSDAGEIAAPYVEAVNATVSAGIMNGTTESTFAPNATANRGMAATVILRMYELLHA